MIPRRVEQPPARRLGVSPLVIVEHDPGEVAQLAVPLALRQQEPVERLAQAALQGIREERLRVADEADLAPAQAGLLPEQPHQAVGVGAGGGVALPVGDEEESGIPRRDAPLLQRPQDLAGETIDEQRVRGIDGIVMDRDAGVPAPRRAQLLAQHRPLPDIQVECGRQHEEDRGPVADTPIDHPADVVFARVFRRSGWEAGEIDPG